jgi:hypothetical protein
MTRSTSASNRRLVGLLGEHDGDNIGKAAGAELGKAQGKRDPRVQSVACGSRLTGYP